MALACAVPALAAPPAHFYFVQITDTHWGARDGVALTRKAVDAINALPWPIEFVVHTGDMCADNVSDASVVRQGLAAMKGLRAPVYYVAGNHDVLAPDASRTAALCVRHFGPLSRRVDVRGVACLFFCSEPLLGGYALAGYDALGWLKENLGQSGGRPVLLFQHAPAVGRLFDGSDEPRSDDGTLAEWEALVRRHVSIKAVIAGHVHRDELHWVGSVPVYVSAAIARFWERQPSFRVYEYWDGRLSYWTEYLESARLPAGQADDRMQPETRGRRGGLSSPEKR